VNIDITRARITTTRVADLKVVVTTFRHRIRGLPTFGNREIKTIINLHDGETNMLQAHPR